VVKVVNKEKKYGEAVKICDKNKSTFYDIMEKENEIFATFSVTPQTAKVMVTVH
jgi:hypothetical protein